MCVTMSTIDVTDDNDVSYMLDISIEVVNNQKSPNCGNKSRFL